MTSTLERAPSEQQQPRRKRALSPFGVGAAVIALLVTALIAYPLGAIAVRLLGAFRAESLATVFLSSWFPGMMRDTLFYVGTSAVIAVAVAAVLAWINERTDARFRGSGLLPLVPLFMPSIAVAIGWVVLAAPDIGFLNGILTNVFSSLGITPELDVFTPAGLIFVMVLCLVPYAYLPISAGFRNLDSSLEEAARLSGSGTWRTLRTVSLPSIAPALLAGFVLVIIVGFSFYSVPVVIGARFDVEILAVRIIESIRAQYPPAYDVSVILSAILLVGLVAVWLFQQRVTRGGRFAFTGGRSSNSSPTKLGGSRWVFRALLIVYGTLATVLPLIALLIVSFQTYWQSNPFSGPWTLANYQTVLFTYPINLRAIQNSLLLGVIGGAATVLLAALLVLYSRNRSNRLARVVDSVSKLPAAVPNAVIAVGFIFAFGGPPFNLGGTLLILALAYFVTYLPYVAIAVEPSILQVHPSLEEASVMSGAGQGRTFRRVVLPIALPGLFAAWALVFVRFVGDLEVSVLLGTGTTPVIGFVLLDIYDGGNAGHVATLALIMTIISAVVISIMLWLGRPRWKRASNARRRSLTHPKSDRKEVS